MRKAPAITAHVNKFPSCVLLKLNGDYCKQTTDHRAKQLHSLFSKAHQNQKNLKDLLSLNLSIRFGEESVKVAGGAIRFGLKRGELKLELLNAIVPIESQGLTTPFQHETTLEVQRDRSTEIEGGISFSSIASLAAKAKGSNKRTEKLTCKTYSVSTGGSESNPVWTFEANHEYILKGQISNVALGNAILSKLPFSIIATFQIRGQQDILLTEAEGLWDRNIGRNKLAVLEREFFLRFISPKLKPFLSFVEIGDEQ